jgi:hypothetical protein
VRVDSLCEHELSAASILILLRTCCSYRGDDLDAVNLFLVRHVQKGHRRTMVDIADDALR